MTTILDQPAYTRPVHPGTATITPRLQARTARSFEAEAPPDRLAIWLVDRDFRPVPRSNNPSEYARLGRGRTDEGKPRELAVLYWSGSVLCQGAGAADLAALLTSICEEAPATVCMFDSLGDADAQRKGVRRG